MYASQVTTNTTNWDSILNAMTQEVNHTPTWTAVGGYRSHYYAARPVRRTSVRRKIAWSRILLPLLALACISAYQANSNTEQQYQNDYQSIYSKVAR
ncbi:MAG TPA: hypothetical protein VGL56_01430 [Fimbriimonadaceae bacterium]|jgi:hypothetical protein